MLACCCSRWNENWREIAISCRGDRLTFEGIMAEPEGKQLVIQFWAPDDVPAEFRNLAPKMANDAWVAYVPPGLMEEDLVRRFLSSGEVSMTSLPDGGALFAGPAETHTPETETN